MDIVFADEMAGLREFHDFARMGGGLDLWVKRGQAPRRGGFREQNIVEKLARAFRPGEGKRVRSCFVARNFKGRQTSGAQIHVEYAGATRANNIERPWHR